MIIDSHEHLIFPTKLQLEKMEKSGVDKSILFCTTPHPEKARNLEELKMEMSTLFKVLEGKNAGAENIKQLKNNIKELTNVIKQYPDKFYGFGSMPLGLSTDEIASWIKEQIINNGLKGVGEFTPGSDMQIQQLEPIIKVLVDFPGLPIWVHTFNPVSMDGIKSLMELTKKYPSVPVIFGHMGGYNWMKVLDFAKSAPNVYVDLSAAFSTLAVQMAICEIPERCLFASDAPYGDPFISRQLVEFASESKSIRKRVLGENILELIE